MIAKFVTRVPIRMSHLGGIVVSGRHIVAAPRVAGRLWGRFDGRDREVALLDEEQIAGQLDVDDTFRTCVCTPRSLAVYSAELTLLWRREASSPKACFWNGHLLMASSDSLMLLEPSSGAVVARRDLPECVHDPLMWLQRAHVGPAVLFDGDQDELRSHVFLDPSSVTDEREPIDSEGESAGVLPARRPMVVKGILHDLDVERARCLLETEAGALELRAWPDSQHLLAVAPPAAGVDGWEARFLHGRVLVMTPRHRLLLVEPDERRGVLEVDFSRAVDVFPDRKTGSPRVDWVQLLNGNYVALSRHDSSSGVEVWELSFSA